MSYPYQTLDYDPVLFASFFSFWLIQCLFFIIALRYYWLCIFYIRGVDFESEFIFSSYIVEAFLIFLLLFMSQFEGTKKLFIKSPFLVKLIFYGVALSIFLNLIFLSAK